MGQSARDIHTEWYIHTGRGDNGRRTGLSWNWYSLGVGGIASHRWKGRQGIELT